MLRFGAYLNDTIAYAGMVVPNLAANASTSTSTAASTSNTRLNPLAAAA